MAKLIAEQKLVASRPKGDRFDVRAGIGRPYAIDPHEWACPVVLTGLYDKLPDVRGASSLQALCLAASLLRRLLTGFVKDGGKLYHVDGHAPFEIVSSFSDVGATGESTCGERA